MLLEKTPAFFSTSESDIPSVEKLCRQTTDLTDYPFAVAIEQNVVIYEGASLGRAIENLQEEKALLAEFNACLDSGPGVFVIKGAYPDKALIDAVTRLFNAFIATEKATGGVQGDHFGTNERIWNSLQKVAEADPALFIAYYGNPMLALASNAWLGPFYQITAQVNNVKPGSAAQTPHRDYHLGFQSADVIARFPSRAQVMSQYLTLQGAIAHTDMPLASGPTLLLPYSQQLPGGYLSIRQQDTIDYFNANYVQLPLEKGDAVFFSPALFHGAGANVSKTDRMANLVQVSSAFGRPMETVNRLKMIASVFPVLQEMKPKLTRRMLRDVIAALADGYSFPTNLDADPPVGGNAPRNARDFLEQAFREGWSAAQLENTLNDHASRQKA